MSDPFLWARAYTDIYWGDTNDTHTIGWITAYEGFSYAAMLQEIAHYSGEWVILDSQYPGKSTWEPRVVLSRPYEYGGSATPPPDALAPAPPALPANPTWTALTVGDDVPIRGGYFYDAMASLKTSHTKQNITDMLASKGVQLISFDEAAPQGDNRQVHVVAFATVDSGTVPWKVPWFIPGDSSTLLSVKTAPKGAGAPALQSSGSDSTVEIVAGLALAGLLGVGGWALWRRHKKQPILPKPIRRLLSRRA